MSKQQTITRRGLLGAGASSLAAMAASRPKPNIVIILADDLGYGDLSCYGAADLRTPNVDALVAAGVRFDQFYANSPVCSPTRSALLTGRFPDCAGVPGVIRTDPANSWGYLSSQATLLPQVLRPAGYRSAIVGKWHLGLESPNLPNERGFDHFHGFLGDMMDDYRTHLRHGNNYMRRNREVITPQGHATDLFTDWAIEYVNDCKRDSKPFLLYLAYNAPHAPIQPPDEWLARVRERLPALNEKRMKLVALIEHLDASIGRVLARLKENGQLENTLVIFASDNGGDLAAGASSGRLRDGKGSMYEGGIRVPMCAVWPGHITPGLRCDFPAATMDLLPTLCEVTGAAVPSGVNGISILPSLLGKQQPAAERSIVYVRREGGPRYEGREFHALRRGDWKLLQNTPFQPYELYNLREDPLEQHDLAKKDPANYKRLVALLTRHLQRAGATPWQAPASR